MECERLSKCPFFNEQMNAMPAVADMMRQKYCLSEKAECARYQVAAAGLEVPVNLFPHESERAKELLRRL